VRLLLDTHVWLWSLLAPTRLSRSAAESLEDVANELWLSPVSVWETLLLIEKGRVEVSVDPSRWVKSVLQSFPVRDALMSRQIAVLSRSVEVKHQDPADRFIAATAMAYGLTLVTADQRLLAGAPYEVLTAV
jgi:PIN domain nuclease of toxin-antitoxin system